MSRGATIVYAETMALVVIDIAKINNISPFTLIEKIESNSQIRFADDAYSAFNILRDPSHQVGTISDINNNNSFRSKEIRA
jgi:hypothetical protein